MVCDSLQIEECFRSHQHVLQSLQHFVESGTASALLPGTRRASCTSGQQACDVPQSNSSRLTSFQCPHLQFFVIKALRLQWLWQISWVDVLGPKSLPFTSKVSQQ